MRIVMCVFEKDEIKEKEAGVGPLKNQCHVKLCRKTGGGSGLVGRPVATDTNGMQFESTHQRNPPEWAEEIKCKSITTGKTCHHAQRNVRRIQR